jgi:hypothetical protein
MLTIEAPDINENTTLKIYNTFGQLMLQQQITSTKTQLDLSPFVKGLYVVQISDEQNNVNTNKIVVQ